MRASLLRPLARDWRKRHESGTMQPVFQLILPFQLELPFEAGGFPATRAGGARASGSPRSLRPKRVRRERTGSMSLELPLAGALLCAVECDV